jgi:hypothetical protein
VVTASSRPRAADDDPSRRKLAVAGLVIAAVALLAILPVRRGTDAGFALVVAPVLLASTAAVWRLGAGALLWGAVLGCLLVLMFGAYAFAGLQDDGEIGVFLIDVAVVVGGVLTVAGSVGELRRLLARRGHSS